jgi:hypothetical protein
MKTRSRSFGATLLAICGAGALWAGCGGGEIAPLDKFDGSEPPTAKERAASYAGAVNLRASDFPYFKAMPDEAHRDRGDQSRLGREIARCIGGEVEMGGEELVAKADSATFGTAGTGGLLTVQSEVEVVRDADVTARRAQLYRNRRVRACLDRVVPRALEEAGDAQAEIGRVSTAWRPSPLPGLAWSFGYRIRASVTTGGSTQLAAYHRGPAPVSAEGSVPLYIDLFAFHVGRAEISLVATGAPAPVSKVLERNLLRMLSDRAESHSP